MFERRRSNERRVSVSMMGWTARMYGGRQVSGGVSLLARGCSCARSGRRRVAQHWVPSGLEGGRDVGTTRSAVRDGEQARARPWRCWHECEHRNGGARWQREAKPYGKRQGAQSGAANMRSRRDT
ncbi:hypothetical protein GUJ93_ZPchr0006g43553 [Zizania palustris]|uniref:Uncharacterized protein n=1 Tax=Zizania palustris TaxID=103762 RepID=A0A8J5SXP5_ZIZPA|nr:hypothetical protein GUJ93_ZPchr0006g43553 [Zizania palustris]